jgi:gamma-glutamyltranspeptidase / glutathione hydrolase
MGMDERQSVRVQTKTGWMHCRGGPFGAAGNLLAVLVAVAAVALVAFSGCGRSGDGEDGIGSRPGVAYSIPEQHEMGTGYTAKPGWETSEFAVAAANPLATDAGYQILRAGGSAADAAIAIQMVLTLVEPQSSGIGGGAFVMHWDGHRVAAYNGREAAPARAGENLFLDSDGNPLSYREAVHSGLSVGVPGTLAVLWQVHREHGRLPWADLFVPAIRLAEEGFAISPRLHRQLDNDRRLREDDIARALYYDEEGRAHPEGHNLRNPALAEILRQVAQQGLSAFYEGPVASSIVERVRLHPRPGFMRSDDLSSYPHQDLETEPICTPWREFTVCGFPPPSSGHLTVMQILGIMEHLDMPDWEFVHDTTWVDMNGSARTVSDAAVEGLIDEVDMVPDDLPAVADTADTLAAADTAAAVAVAAADTATATDTTDAGTEAGEEAPEVHWRDPLISADWLHYYLEASKLAYADRNRYIADPRYVDAPGGDWERMLDPGYLAYRAALIGSDAMDEAAPGDPGGDYSRYGTAPAQPDSGTSHISIIDRDGNAVSMTTTIEQVFGSRIMADGGTGLTGGFHLNNELTDFSLSPVDDDGRPIANRVQPGKRPRSSMAPSLIFHTETGELLAAVGSPGGAGIIHFVAKTILGMYDFGLNAQEAIDLPNFANYNGPSVLEEHRFPQQVIEALEERGHVVLQRQLTSGLQAIQRTGYGFFGGADPRREGVVMGD